MVLDFLGAGCQSKVTKDMLSGVLQGHEFDYPRHFFQDKKQSKFYELSSTLPKEEMWHYEVMGALITRKKHLVTPSLLSKRDGNGHPLTALCLLVTPCLKYHMLIHSVENGFSIHRFEAKHDSITLDDYFFDDDRRSDLGEVKDLLKTSFETESPTVTRWNARLVVNLLYLGNSTQVGAQD